MKRQLHPKIILLSTIAMLQCIGMPGAIAQSITAARDGTGTQVVQQGSQSQITGGTRSIDGTNLFHSFQRFGLNSGQVANFLSTPGTQNILGRVVGGQASLINGQIQVTGGLSNLYLLNPAGIVFGANASLNVPGSFTATSANGVRFNDQWWSLATNSTQMSALVGQPTGLGFVGDTSGTIFNAGKLQVQPGHGIRLIGGQVINTGTIAAPGGHITIAAVPGEQFVRVSQTGSLLSLELPTTDQTAINQPVAAASLPELLTGQDLGNTGATVENGQVMIAGTPIPQQAGTTIVTGQVTVAAAQAQTAQVDILGQQVGIISAKINASGNKGGGQIRIGGDEQGRTTAPRAQSTTVDANSQITADAITQGDGGRVIVWADQNTRVHGKISATGGTRSGNGGFVETSGKAQLDVTNSQVNTSAASGNPGTWLLDPTNIDIVSGGSGSFNSGGLFDPPTTGVASQIDPTLIETAIDGGSNVIITTASGVGGNGDINVQSSINQTGASNATLTITGRRFAVANSSTINLASTGALTLNLNSVLPEANVPTTSVQAAIDMIGTTAGSRTINLNSGTYAGNTLTVNKNLTLNGTGTTQTILSGENLRPVVNVSPGITATISNLGIQNGQNATAGGGIINNGTLTVNTVALQQNQSTADGGGIFNAAGGTINLNTSTIQNNTATQNGGGIANAGILTSTNSQITNNQANVGGGLYGDTTSNSQLQNNTITGNSAQQGGGIFLQTNSTANINQGSISQNTSQGIGGGIASAGTATLNQTTISNNNANGNGGGIFNAGSLTVDQMNFTSNTSGDSGGGLFNQSQLQASNLTFTTNQAQLGGGIFNSGIATVDRSTFVQNTAAIDGGGIRVGFPATASQLTLTNSELRGNNATFGGGLEASETAVVTVQNTQFINNQATDRGGALQNDDSAQMTIDQSTIDGNTSVNGGGGAFNFGTLNITNSAITNNQSTSGGSVGGGIFNDIKPNGGNPSPGQISATNVTISGNEASTGGGFQINQGNATINSSTIANNTATNRGGGLNQAGGTIAVGNSLIATNTAPIANDVSGQFTDQGNNLVGNNDGSTSFTNSTLVGTNTAPIDPLLAPLGSYGGTTQTQTLLPGSPALDTGNTGTAPASDQRGIGRLGNADIGAAESQGFTLTPITGTPQTTLINTPFPQPLTVTVTSNSGEPVDGGRITFTPPNSSANITGTATTVTIAGGQATIPAPLANSNLGTYQITANAAGVIAPATFDLTNASTIPPVIPPTTPPGGTVAPTPAPPTPPTVLPTEPTTTSEPNPSSNQPRARFARNNCDIQSIGGRLKQDIQDWQLRIGNRAEVARLLKAGKINAALQAIDMSKNSRQTQAAYLNPQTLPVGCPAAKLSDLTAETRPALIYTFAQADQLDIILVTAGQNPIHQRISTANQAKLTQTITAAKQGEAQANRQLYDWLITPFAAELKAQAIETLVFSLDQSMETIPLAELSNGQQTLSQQYQVRQLQN
ncbi:filamentous hemagglutinin N-terminal domain-containing protein [filamentous cyanobacterium LEGE 11480]|uniref:Filamentous hemagglutinin N-terminal domain-containing protein n=1 Tax=Romeriopsis navalis LEGE 11480 TaxID=2777977 RepID=A0A928VUZ8_9CYAN|nr:filamentous hemagglutinin N-terminal domain-containing protein [Romeriopsis navalis]MBE9033070.1 filamentous hemagglutinin N-terminal domain-containing protein [Romeriopsis navalis LEGE 11480]